MGVLAGTVALVAGATRGAGRGIAVELGYALLVNDIWGGDELTEWDAPFWRHNLEHGLLMQQRGLWTHLITSHAVAPLMVACGRGLIIEVTDGDEEGYRGSLFYDLVKHSVQRVARGMAADLQPHGVTALAITPGFLRSEAVLDIFGVREQNWRDGIARDPHFAQSETPRYVGRAIVALASDPHVVAGRADHQQLAAVARVWFSRYRRPAAGLGAIPRWRHGRAARGR